MLGLLCGFSLASLWSLESLWFILRPPRPSLRPPRSVWDLDVLGLVYDGEVFLQEEVLEGQILDEIEHLTILRPG